MQSCCCNMLLTLGLIFLLSPFATFQSITSDKRDTGGSNVNKANAVFNLSKLKTTAVPSKQSFNSTQKPNTLTVTTLPTAASNHKSTTANPVTTSKSKLSVAVVETTASLAKSPTATNTNINRGKHKSNKSLSAKLLSLSEEKPSKDKPGPTGAPKQQLTIKKLNTLKTIKNKSQHDDEQMLTKSPSTSDTKNVKDRLNHNVHSISSGGIKTTKEKFLTSGNQTHLDSPLTSSDEKSKDKSAQSLPSLPASGSKTTQDKAKVSVKQAIAHKHLTKVDEKFKRKSTPSVLSLPGSVKTLQDKDTISNNQTIFDTSLPSNDKKLKDKHPPNVLPLPTNGTKTTKDKPKFGNKTIVDTHLPSNDEKTKDKPGERDSGSIKDKEMGTTAVTHTRSIQAACNDSAPSQSIRVVISNDGDLSHTKKQEMTLKPGAPLVMTHRINLIPGGCSRGCEAEMDAVKARLTRLEKEMSSLKKKCPCSANCPNDCGDKGKCEHGKCICSKGFIGLDCSKCAKDIECSKGHEKKNTSTKTDTTTTTFVDQNKDSLNKKVAGKDFSNNSTTSHNSPSNSDNEKLEEASRGETENTTFSTTTIHKIRKEGPNDRLSTHLQDDPLSNITLIGEKKTNSTSKRGNESKSKSHENPSLTNKNVATKPIETDKTEKKNDPSIHNRTTTTSSTKDNTDVLKNNTGIQHSPRKPGGLGSVKAVNISSSSFTITWLAPHHMFKNFTVIRREIQTDSDKDKNDEYGEEIVEIDSFYVTRNSTEIQNKGSNTTLLFGKGVLSRGQTETKSISRTLPGSARSFEFKNLKANTRYVVHVFGSTAHRRSKIQGVTASTGPDPPTELVFSNVTESSLTVSWTKPNTIFTGFKVTYNNIATGKSQFVTVEPQQSSVVLSALSVGSSYNISVTTYKGRTQSDELTSIITTVPAPPTHLQVINVTDNKAMLHWTPSLGKVDRFIISYESSKTPNVTVTVMVSGNSVQYQLKALQKGTLYNVKVRTQKNNLKSMGISTTFTTANVVKASEIGARSAVISWKKSVALCRYKVIYQAGKEKPKEAILEPKITEYKLMGLMPSSSYFVVVQGEKNGKYISLVTSQFITGKLRFPFPTECSQELLNGALESGEVNIYPQGKEGQAVRVYCDMETDGGGWTVFQRRINGKTDFYRTWDEYKIGFGNLSEEFWLGNEPLHNLTSVGPVSLRVDLKSGNDTAYARYTNFSVASEARNYTLSLSGYTGTAGDSLRYHNGRPFSTIDKEPDPQGIHCAKAYVGGWWYKNCYKVNLNGLYGMNSNNQGIVWIDWKGKDSSIPFSEMKFRPSRFSPATHG